MATRRLPRFLSNSKPSLRPTTQVSRPYHSYTHPAPPSPFTPIESTILSAATHHIPTQGFTNTSLTLGCHDAGYVAAATNLFPKGALSLVEWHLFSQRSALKEHDEILSGDGGVGTKVKALTWERLMGNKAIIHRWQEALALLASHPQTSISELAKLADEMFFLASDTSVDTSWYTKRLSLSLIYSSTELFMTTDKSADFVATREFMERRFEDAREVGGVIGSVGEWVGFTGRSAVNILRSKGVRI